MRKMWKQALVAMALCAGLSCGMTDSAEAAVAQLPTWQVVAPGQMQNLGIMEIDKLPAQDLMSYEQRRRIERERARRAAIERERRRREMERRRHRRPPPPPPRHRRYAAEIGAQTTISPSTITIAE